MAGYKRVSQRQRRAWGRGTSTGLGPDSAVFAASIYMYIDGEGVHGEWCRGRRGLTARCQPPVEGLEGQTVYFLRLGRAIMG
jgi:hypothetical protein